MKKSTRVKLVFVFTLLTAILVVPGTAAAKKDDDKVTVKGFECGIWLKPLGDSSRWIVTTDTKFKTDGTGGMVQTCKGEIPEDLVPDERVVETGELCYMLNPDNLGPPPVGPWLTTNLSTAAFTPDGFAKLTCVYPDTG